MGTHAEWTENLVAEIDLMHQSRADSLAALRTDTGELLAQFQKENEERRATVGDLLAQFRKEHGEMAEELHESLAEFGGDVREAAEIWQNRTYQPTRERSRPEEPGEHEAKQGKKKRKQR